MTDAGAKSEGMPTTGRGPASDPERWVDRHGDALYRFALLRLREPDLAADVVQETFLDALKGRAGFSGRSSERTWLIGILKHKILDQLRRARRERPIGTGEGEAIEGAEWPFDRRGHWKEGPRRWAGDPDRILERREFWEVFGRCLDRLPDHLSEAFFRRELDGQTGEAICAQAGITPANLWARLHRARLLLRGCLERHWFGGPGRPNSRI